MKKIDAKKGQTKDGLERAVDRTKKNKFHSSDGNTVRHLQDEAHISDKQLDTISKAVSKDEIKRIQKLNEIKQKLNNKEYSVQTDAVASSILSHTKKK